MTVVVQHISADGTIDEQILRALKAKDKTQSALIAAVKANLESLKHSRGNIHGNPELMKGE